MPPLEQTILEAFGREQERRRASGLPPLTYGQFVDQSARGLERRGDTGRARTLRDALVGQQAAGESFGAVVERTADAAPTFEAGDALRRLRTSEQARALPQVRDVADDAAARARPSGALQVAEGTLLGAKAFADTASFGLSERLSNAVAGEGVVPESLRPTVAGRSGRELMQAGTEAVREEAGAAGRVGETAGQVLGFFTPAGWVSRAGRALAVTQKARPVLNTLGRVLQSRLASLPVTGAGLRAGRAGQQAAFGEGEDALKTLASIPAGAAQDALVSVAAIPFRFLGQAVEKGIMRTRLPEGELAKLWGRTIAEMPLKHVPRAVAAKFGGGMAEFLPFAAVPNLVDPRDPASLVPEAKVLFNPTEFGSEKWAQAGASLMRRTLENLQEHGIEEALAGGFVGALGGHPVARPGSAAEHRRLRKLTAEEWQRTHESLLEQFRAAQKNPEIIEPLLGFLAESQRLKESVAKQRGDVQGDLADFGKRAAAWIEQVGLESGVMKPPKEGEAAPPAPAAAEPAPPAPAKPEGQMLEAKPAGPDDPRRKNLTPEQQKRWDELRAKEAAAGGTFGGPEAAELMELEKIARRTTGKLDGSDRRQGPRGDLTAIADRLTREEAASGALRRRLLEEGKPAETIEVSVRDEIGRLAQEQFARERGVTGDTTAEPKPGRGILGPRPKPPAPPPPPAEPPPAPAKPPAGRYVVARANDTARPFVVKVENLKPGWQVLSRHETYKDAQGARAGPHGEPEPPPKPPAPAEGPGETKPPPRETTPPAGETKPPSGETRPAARVVAQGGNTAISVEAAPGQKPTPHAAKYAVIPLEALRTSHEPGREFAAREGYPEGLQERRYAEDALEQQKVEGIARNLNPAELINTAARATEGPPVVTPDATVINGNGRGMGLLAASPEARAAYRKYLKEHAAEFGIDPSKIGDDDVVLVRVVDMDPASKEAAEFGRRGNIAPTKALGPIDRAARFAELLPEGLLENLGGDADMTFSEAVVDPSRGRAFRRWLEDSMPATERAEFFKDDGGLTDAGKDVVRNLLLVKALGRDTVHALTPELRRTLADASIQLGRIRRDANLAGVNDALNEAIRYYLGPLERGKVSPAEYFDPSRLFPPAPISEAGRVFLEFVHANRDAPKRLRDGLSHLLAQRESSGGLLGETEPLPDTARRAFGPKAKTAAEAAGDGPLAFTPEQRAMLAPGDPLLGMPATLRQTPKPSPTPTPAFRGRRVGRHQVIDALADLPPIRVPIRVARMGKYSKIAAGFFKVKPRVVRVRVADDIPVATHEVGHALEEIVFPLLKADPAWRTSGLKRGMNQELIDLGHALYGSTRPGNGYASEGWAEFTRHYVTDRAHLSKVAPQVLAWVEGNLLKGNPRLRKQFNLASDRYEQWAAQGAENRAAADMRVKGRLEGAVESLKKAFSKRAWIDELAPLQEAARAAEEGSGATLRPSRNPFRVATALQGSANGIVHEMVWGRQRAFDAQVVGPGLHEIWRGVGGIKTKTDSIAFAGYLWAKRAREVWGRGKNPGMPREDVDAIIRAVESDPRRGHRWQLAAAKTAEWNRNLLTYLLDAGAISVEDHGRLMDAGRSYVPLSRWIQGAPASTLRAALEGSPLRRFSREGSGRQIRDPREAMVANAVGLISFAHRRMVSDALVRLAGLPGMGRYIEHVPKEKVERALSIETIRKELEAAGADLSGVADDALVHWWEPKMLPGSKDPILPLRLPGSDKVQWFQVSHELYEAMRSMDLKRIQNPIGKWLLSKPRQAFTLGATGLRATFGLVTNTLRDFTTSLVQSRDPNPLTTTARWAKHTGSAYRGFFTGKKNPYAELFDALGGPISQPLGLDAPAAQRTARGLHRSRAGRVVTSPTAFIDFLRDAFQVSEGAPRAAEMERIGKERGWDPSKPLDRDTMIAMLEGARQVTTDFNAGGSFAKWINQAVPFFNQAFQSPRAFARAWKRNPRATALKGILGLTIPTLYLWWRNKDEEWYEDMPARERYTHWHVKVGEQRARIPRPFEPGYVFSVIPEAIIDAAYREDPEGVGQAVAHMLEQSNPLPVQPTIDDDGKPSLKLNAGGLPVIAGEAAEQLANFDTHFETPIDPVGERDRPAAERFGPYTSGLAKTLGRTLGWSPRRIDHALQGGFAGLGRDIPAFADAAVSTGRRLLGKPQPSDGRPRRDLEPTDIPVVGGLFAQGGAEGVASKAVNELYRELRRAGERRASKENPETDVEQQRRRRLEEGAAAVGFLRDIQRKEPNQGKRQELQREIREVAKRVVADAREVAAAGPTDRGQSAREDRIIRQIDSKVADIRHATDGTGDFGDMTPARRTSAVASLEKEVERLAKEFAQVRGIPWQGSIADMLPKLAAKLDLAKDSTRRRRPRLPGPGLGVPPSDASFRALEEDETLRAGGRARRILAPGTAR